MLRDRTTDAPRLTYSGEFVQHALAVTSAYREALAQTAASPVPFLAAVSTAFGAACTSLLRRRRTGWQVVHASADEQFELDSLDRLSASVSAIIGLDPSRGSAIYVIRRAGAAPFTDADALALEWICRACPVDVLFEKERA